MYGTTLASAAFGTGLLASLNEGRAQSGETIPIGQMASLTGPLAVDGVASVGAVALPGLGLTLTSGAPAVLAPANAPLRMLVSRTRPAAEAVQVAERMGADLLAMGSAGAKAMAVVRGEADIYLHTGGQYEWDNCAPVAVAQAAGLHVSRVDGSALRYNNADTYLPDLLICRRELADEVLRLASEYSPG